MTILRETVKSFTAAYRYADDVINDQPNHTIGRTIRSLTISRDGVLVAVITVDPETGIDY